MSLAPATRARIESLLASHPVILFMKGSRDAPQCGFSAAATDRLNSLLEDYATVDVLADEEIRKYYQQNTRQRSNKYDEGYYDGLKLVARALKQSRDLMMEEISDRLAAALKVY